METAGFDIETAPLKDVISRIYTLFPFDETEVKTGNIKNPDLIAEKIEAARKSHIGTIMQEAQLNPLLSYVCAIGIKHEKHGTEMRFAHSQEEEPDLLAWFWGEVGKTWTNSYTRWVGFNSNEFDIPYLFKRSWLSGVHPYYPC